LIRDPYQEECSGDSVPSDFAPLACRVVRAVRAVRVLGAGLGFPVGEPSIFTAKPPIKNPDSQLKMSISYTVARVGRGGHWRRWKQSLTRLCASGPALQG